MTHLTRLLEPLAAKYNLDFISFGRNSSGSAPHDCRNSPAGTLTLSDAFGGTALEPAPISPTDSVAYKVLSGTILATYKESYAGKISNATKMIVAPGVAGGNTGRASSLYPSNREPQLTSASDTRFYWNLTRNIFRYNHLSDRDVQGLHTVGEGEPKLYSHDIWIHLDAFMNSDTSDGVCRWNSFLFLAYNECGRV